MSERQDDRAEPRTRDTHGKTAVRYPVNRVLGVVETRAELDAATRALAAAGFPAEEISTLSGTLAADAVRSAGGRGGSLDIVMRMGEWTGLSDNEATLKAQYEQALRDGRFVIAVMATTDERRTAAARLLNDRGARFVHYFGCFGIERLDGD
jgi:hypothetical protein